MIDYRLIDRLIDRLLECVVAFLLSCLLALSLAFVIAHRARSACVLAWCYARLLRHSFALGCSACSEDSTQALGVFCYSLCEHAGN